MKQMQHNQQSQCIIQWHTKLGALTVKMYTMNKLVGIYIGYKKNIRNIQITGKIQVYTIHMLNTECGYDDKIKLEVH
jgi:hypothetical protein